MDFNKLTLKSQEAVAAAQELARRMGNPEPRPAPRRPSRSPPEPLPHPGLGE